MDRDLCFGCMKHTGSTGGVCPDCGFDPGAYVAAPHQLVPGTMLDNRYMVGRVLGEGGFGITYVGRDTLLDMKVAVKEFYMSGYVNRNTTYSTIVQASIGTHAEMFAKNREKFLQEARVLAKFSTEEGIVGIRDFFQENNTAYIVMEFLDGITMRDYLNKAGRLTWDQTHRILLPILISLGNIHRHDIIHRDISPDNIMMTRDGKVKLLDFGAARSISKTDIKSLSVILKPGYAPEEQYRSKGQQGPWSDIYALCATMYRCLTGEVPDDSMERMYNDQVQSPYERGVCPVAISNVLMKGLAVRQADRFHSIPEFRSALAAAEHDPHNPATAAPAAPRLPRPIDPNATVYAGSESQQRFNNDEPITNPSGAPVSAPAPVRRTGPTTGAPHTGGRPVNAAPAHAIPRTDAPQPGTGSAVGTPRNQSTAGSTSGAPVRPAVQSVPGSAPSQRTPADQPRIKKASGKKLALALILIPVILLILLGAVSLISGPAFKSSGEIPHPFNNYSITINDNTYTLPIMVSELAADGWVAKDEAKLQETLKPGSSTSGINLTNNYGTISVSFKNPTDSTLTVAECPINYIHISYDALTYNDLNDIRNSAEIANGMEMGSALESAFRQKSPKGYGIDKNYGITYTYEEDTSNAYYEITFDQDDKTLTSVSVRAEIPENFFTSTYAVYPPEFDTAAFEQDAQLQWLVQAGSAFYGTSIYVSDLLAMGWELEEAPEYVTSGSSDQILLKFGSSATASIQIKNHFDTAIIPEYCFVDDITVYSSDAGNSNTFILRNVDGSVEITKELGLNAVVAMLQNAGIYYEYDDNALTFYPYGDNDSRHITIQFLTSGSISSYSLYSNDAVSDFFGR